MKTKELEILVKSNDLETFLKKEALAHQCAVGRKNKSDHLESYHLRKLVLSSNAVSSQSWAMQCVAEVNS